MGENCGQCLSIESKFQCGYCRDNDTCIPAELTTCQQRLQGTNSVNQCDKPVITDVRIIFTHLIYIYIYMYNGVPRL